MYKREDFKHVDYLWDDNVADKLDPIERLRYRSNLLGADQRITNTGGGNTSSKINTPDPLDVIRNKVILLTCSTTVSYNTMLESYWP